jgi:hypothetical protein
MAAAGSLLAGGESPNGPLEGRGGSDFCLAESTQVEEVFLLATAPGRGLIATL